MENFAPERTDTSSGFSFDPSVAPSGIVDRLRIAHNIDDAYVTPDRFGKIEILKKADVSTLGLACTTVGSASMLDAFKSYAASLLLGVVLVLGYYLWR